MFKDFDKNGMARAMGLSLAISRKQSIEICNFIRRKEVTKVKDILSQVIEKKVAIPYKRFNKDVGHKKKIGAGRYPIKSSREILKLIESVESNAQFKGLNTSKLVITHISVNQSSKAQHYGRKSRRRMKRANIEVVVSEKETKDVKKSESKKGDEKKVEHTKEVKHKEENVENKK